MRLSAVLHIYRAPAYLWRRPSRDRGQPLWFMPASMATSKNAAPGSEHSATRGATQRRHKLDSIRLK